MGRQEESGEAEGGGAEQPQWNVVCKKGGWTVDKLGRHLASRATGKCCRVFFNCSKFIEKFLPKGFSLPSVTR